MSPSSPSTASVLTQVDSLGPPGTPVTIREIASAFDCAVERLDTRLDRLVSHRILKVKQVGDGRRVWWRPAGPQAVDPPDTAASPTPVRRGKQLVGGGRSSSEGSETDRLHSLVFDQTVQFTGVLDPDGTLLDANESALRFGGLSRDDVVGRPFWEADWWQLSRRAQRRLQAAISRAGAGEMVRYEVTVQGASRTVPIDFSLRPVSDDGEVTLLIAEGRDITDLKAHEQQLQRQLDALESELAEVLDRISDGFYSLDTGFRFRYINDHAQALLGVDESARGEDIRDTIETTEQFRTALETAVESQEPVFFEDYYEPLGEWFDNAIYPSETGLSIYFRDISERKRLETELRTETEHFQVALENSPIIAFRLDADLRYTWVGNPRREFPEEEILGKRDDELLEPEAAAVVMAPKRAALETGARVREEIVVGLPGGETIYDLTIEPLFDDAGEISGLTATAVDLTERTRTREALRRSEERLRLALQAADVGTWELDLRSEESPVRSLEHDRIFGYEEGIDDWSFEVFLDHVHPDDRAAVQRGFEEAFETGSWAFECRIRRADGRERWIAAEGEFHTDSDGEPVRAVGVVRDISDRMTRQRALEASERRYRTLVANFPNGGVALLDSALRHRIVDGLGFDAIGLDVEALRGRRVDEVFPAAIAAVLEPEYRATLDGEARSFELAVGERICEFRTIPLSNAKGVDGLLSIFQDITLRKTRQERQLTTLAGLNETVQEIAHHVIESSTQAEIEQVVCDRFDAADAYTGAWVGRLDPTASTIRPSAAGDGDSDSGVTTDCEGCAIPVEPDAPTISGPIAAAIETAEAQFVHTSPTDPVYQQWSQSTPIRHRPGIVVPVRYESHLYGVVVVYTDRDGFDPRERDTLGRLGRIVGHAINAIERKRALVGGRATEVVVESAALAEPFLAAADDESMTVTIDRVLILQDDHSLIYYTVEGIDPERFGELLQRLTDSRGVRLLERDGSRSRLELSTETETIHSLVARHGGRITEAGLREGSFEITIQVPLGTAVRPVLDAARTIYPDLTLVSQTTVTPSTPTPADAFGRLVEALTDRQREVLEVGYYAGFFEWPRGITGDELAELIGVTPATVHHHLRHGQRKLLDAFFEYVSE